MGALHPVIHEDLLPIREEFYMILAFPHEGDLPLLEEVFWAANEGNWVLVYSYILVSY